MVEDGGQGHLLLQPFWLVPPSGIHLGKQMEEPTGVSAQAAHGAKSQIMGRGNYACCRYIGIA